MIVSILEDEGEAVVFADNGEVFVVKGPFPQEEDFEKATLPESPEENQQIVNLLYHLEENAMLLLRAEKLFDFVNIGDLFEGAKERLNANNEIINRVPLSPEDITDYSE